MGKSILSIVKEAAERHNTAPPPPILFGTNDRISRIMRQAAKDTMRQMMRSSAWMGLSELRSTWVLALQKGVFAYPLPPDFLRMIINTEHRNGWPMGLIGPATPSVWSHWLSGGGAVAAPMGWRIMNGALFLDPTPATAELVTVEYISRYMVVSDIKEGDYDSESPPNAIAPVVPRDGHLEGDVSRVAHAGSGQEFAYENDPGFDAGLWSVELAEKLKRINPLSGLFPEAQVRREEFTTDTDMPAFSDPYALSLGITWRTRMALGLPYAEAAAEFEEEWDMVIGSDAGGQRAIQLGRSRRDDDVVPLGGGQWMVS